MYWRGVIRGLTGAVAAVVSLHYFWATLRADEARSLPPGTVPIHYQTNQWTPETGLPVYTVQCLLQTRDGYLWIGTRHGLVRFNGKEFRTFPGVNCFSLAEDSDGVLWIGGSEQLVRWNGTDFKGYRLARPNSPTEWQQVLSLCPCRSGGIWVGFDSAIWRGQGERLWPVATAAEGIRTPRALCESHTGRLWMVTETALGVLDPTAHREAERVKFLHGVFAPRCVLESPDGAVWFGGEGGGATLHRLKDGHITDFPENVGIIFDLARDAAGTLWLATQTGLWEARGDHLVRPEGLDEHVFREINCLLSDREGHLWIGTDHDGLFCLRRQAFATYTTQDGLVADDVWSVNQAHDGSLWIATTHGASHFAGGRFINARDPDGGPDDKNNELRTIIEDSSGNVWTSGNGPLFRVAETNLVVDEATASVGAVSSASLDSTKQLWCAFSRFLAQPDRPGWNIQAVGDPQSPPQSLVGILWDRNGDLWLGSNDHGLVSAFLYLHSGVLSAYLVRTGGQLHPARAFPRRPPREGGVT